MINSQKTSQINSGIMSHREQCTHRHGGRKKMSENNEDLLAPPSPIQEESEQEIEADSVISERPRTGKSRQSSASSRPVSRLFGSRPESSRSVFESVPGTRPASRRVSIIRLQYIS